MGKYTKDTKLKVLVKDPATRAILEKNFPLDLEAPTVRIAYGMTIEKCLSFPQVEMTEEAKAAIIEEICSVE